MANQGLKQAEKVSHDIDMKHLKKRVEQKFVQNLVLE